MENSLDEILDIVHSWSEKEDSCECYMQESLALAMPVKIIEGHDLKAIFNSQERRVTLYEGNSCFCITYELFLSCLEVHKVLQEQQCEDDKMRPSGRKHKSCCIN